MNKAIVITILILAFIAGLFLFYRGRPVSAPTQGNTPASTSPSAQKWPTQTNEEAAVTVTITPVDLGIDAKGWKFDVDMNTHSVELDQDMTKSAALVDDQGKEYAPIKWDGPAGGHHREGTLSFAPITPYPQRLIMKIKGVGGVDRSLSWVLNK